MNTATMVTTVDQTQDFHVKNTDLQLWMGPLDVISVKNICLSIYLYN